MSRLRVPVATYRLQFNAGFRFEDARVLADYLYNLGISDIYASPILKARRDSTHGYDVADPTQLNPELGTTDDFDSLTKELQQHGMGLLLDIVPNHMAASDENPWWRDVQERGKDSPFFKFFDIGWLDSQGSEEKASGYRRFFDIGDLAGIRVEDLQVFAATHAFIFRLIAAGKVTGLRLDHIDGLYNPREYLEGLRAGTGGVYTVVEKILGDDETLPGTWPVSGTTGYDFAKAINTLFAESRGLKALQEIYSRLTGLGQTFRDLVYEKKKQVMRELFPEEINALGHWLARLVSLNEDDARMALIEITACLPVYRTYIQSDKVLPADRRYLEAAFEEAAGHQAAPAVALSLLKMVLLLDIPPGLASEDRHEWVKFVRRWQQLTGAIMAKGFEDTVLYNYHPLVSLNEVGGEPDASGLTVEDFHKWNLKRRRDWPHTLNATSTHDTKRSEDVRARLAVLSEIPGEWQAHLDSWMEHNRAKKVNVKGQFMPEPNTEILLYQTLIGAWPLSTGEMPEFRERLKAYMLKAVREAKAITNWIKVEKEYEDALLGFIDAILEETPENEFLDDFLRFQARIAFYGALNSLSQVLLKIASPGVPDFYRGTELWDFSLVDPDNRRPVDFKKRQMLMEGMMQEEPSLVELLSSWRDGRIKMHVTWKGLNARRTYQELFQKGNYIPLTVEGKRRENVIAFARRCGNQWALIAVPRFFTELGKENVPPVGKQAWGNDVITLPDDAPAQWRNIFTGEVIEGSGALPLSAVFGSFPLGLLTPSA